MNGGERGWIIFYYLVQHSLLSTKDKELTRGCILCVGNLIRVDYG